MQATQSINASGKQRRETELATLQNYSQELQIGGESTYHRRREDRRREDGRGAGGREADEGGGDLKLGASELMSVAKLSSTLLEIQEFPLEDRPALSREVTELVERSWLLLEHLLDSEAKRHSKVEEPASRMFLKAQVFHGGRRGPTRELEGRASPETLTAVRAGAGREKQVKLLEETAAGWIAC